jgi:RHS repeat-associated protein
MARFAVGSFFVCLFLSAFSLAQTDPAAGILPFSTQVGGPIDSVDLATGSITLQIPIRSKAGKVPFSFDLVGGSHAFPILATILGHDAFYWSVNSGVIGVPFAASLGVTVPVAFASNQTCGQRQGVSVWSISNVVDATGAAHPLPTTEMWDTDLCYPPETKSFMTTDGSGYTVSGTVSNGAFSYTLYDSAGNTVAGTTLTDPDGTTMSGPAPHNSGTYTDTLGATVITSTINSRNGGAGPDTYEYTDGGGTQRAVTVSYTNYSEKTVFGCLDPVISDIDGASVYLPTTISLPTGGSYQLSYEKTPSYPGYVTGRIQTITLPSGGTVTYGYSGGNNNSGSNCAGTVPTLTRTVNDNNGNNATWTYVNSNTGTSQNYTVTETTPARPGQTSGDTITHYFSGEYETKRVVADASLGTLSTTVTCYNNNFSNCSSPTAAPTGQITQTDVYSALGSSTSSLLETKYDSYGNVTEVKSYTGQTAGTAPSGSPVMDRKIYYGTFSGSTCVGLTNANIHDKVCADESFPNGGTALSQQTLFVRNANGHATQTKGWVTNNGGNVYVSSAATFSTNGTMLTYTDPSTAQITFNYDGSCNGLVSTSTSLPGPMSPSQTWDCNGGVVKSSTDVNGEVTTYKYNDPLWRQTEIDSPDGGVTTTSYSTGATTPWTISNCSTISSGSSCPGGTNSLTSTTKLDGLGRAIQSQLTSDPAGTSMVDTAYDLLGRMYSVSNPHRSASSPTDGMTYYGYDALGRTLQITRPDSTHANYTYTKRATEVQDEGSNGSGTTRVTKVYQDDDLGRLLSVCEVSSVTQQGSNGAPSACGQDISATGFLTTYNYTAPYNECQQPNATCTSTSQPGKSDRVFAYDGLSHLIYENNPESGTTVYTYSSQGDLQTRTRPAANQNNSGTNTTTTYSYDTLHRLTGVTYSNSDNSPTYANPITLNYDQSVAYGKSLTNPLGRMTSASVASSTAPAQEVFSYDAMGRVVDNSQCVGTGCSFMSLPYSYDYVGDLRTSPMSAGVTISYGYDAALHLVGVSSTFNDSNHPSNLFSNTAYNPLGELTQAESGTITSSSGFEQAWSYDNRGRTTYYRSSVNGQATIEIQSGIAYAANNDLLGFADGILGYNWNFSYDDFNRLGSTSRVNGSTTVLGYNYLYDQFGNRWNQQLTAGSGPAPSYSFDANNRITPAPCSGGTTYCYDAAGNLTNDSFHTYAYDPEGHVATVDGGSTATYNYDAFGRRVMTTTGGHNWYYGYDLASRVLTEFEDSSWYRGEIYGGKGRLATYKAGLTFFPTLDLVGTVRNNVTQDYAYNESCASLPFGDDQICWGNIGGGPAPAFFTGQDRDAESNLDRFWYRSYTSTQGRWTVPDPAGLAAVDPTNPQSWNRYAYVLNNPMSFVDPSGLYYCVYLNDAGNGVASVDTSSDAQSDCGPQGGYGIQGTYGADSSVGINSDSGFVTGTGYDSSGNLEYSIAGATGSNSWGAWTQTFALGVPTFGSPTGAPMPTVSQYRPPVAPIGTITAQHPWVTNGRPKGPEPSAFQCISKPSAALPEPDGAAPEQPDAPPSQPPVGGSEAGQAKVDGIGELLSDINAAIGCFSYKLAFHW